MTRKILVVEDERIVAADIQKKLEYMGYSSQIASSGEEALQKVQEDLPDLILMDIVLKGKMDGIEAASQITPRFHIPVVFLTAYADEKTVEKAKVTEPFGYIVKPFDEKELHATIEMALYKDEMERRLREREQLLSTTLASIGDAVITTDTTGVVTFMNHAAESLTGWGVEDARGKRLEEVISPTPLPGDGDFMQWVITHGKLTDCTLLTRSGKEVVVEGSAAPIRDEKGTMGVVVVLRDITERKRVGEALQSERDKLRALFEGLTRTGIGIDIVDENYRILFQNEAMEQRYRDAVGELCYRCYRKREEPCADCAARQAIETGRVEKGEAANVDGKTFEIISAPLSDPHGKIDRAIEVVVDISERKMVEMQLKSLFEASKLINSTMDIQRVFKFISDSCKELVGFDNFTVFLVQDRSLYPVYSSEEIRERLKDVVLKVGEGLVGYSVETKETVLLGNAHEDPRRKSIPGVTEAFTSLIVVPLVVEGECVGAIHISRKEENAYDQNDVEALKPLGEVISAAVRNSKLYGEIKDFGLELEKRIKERSRKIEVLLTTRESLQKKRSWEEGLTTIADAVNTLGFDRCGVFLVNARKKTLDFHHAKGVQLPEKDISLPLRASQYFGVQCVTERKTIHVKDADLVEGKQVLPGASSFVWVPIVVQDEAFAALGADNVESGRNITDEDVKDLEILASMCAAFIDRTRTTVEPVAEEVRKSEIRNWLDPAEGYIVLEKKPGRSFQIFLDLVTHGIPGFVVSRMYPEKVREAYHLVKTPALWLSRAEKEGSISPDDLPKLLYIIGDFTRKCEESVILLDGLEYLVTQTNFDTVLKYLQELRDTVIMRNSRLIIPLYRETLSPREYSILEKEFNVLQA